VGLFWFGPAPINSQTVLEASERRWSRRPRSKPRSDLGGKTNLGASEFLSRPCPFIHQSARASAFVIVFVTAVVSRFKGRGGSARSVEIDGSASGKSSSVGLVGSTGRAPRKLNAHAHPEARGRLRKDVSLPVTLLFGVAGPDARGRLRRNILQGKAGHPAQDAGLVPLCPRSRPHHQIISSDLHQEDKRERESENRIQRRLYRTADLLSPDDLINISIFAVGLADSSLLIRWRVSLTPVVKSAL